MLRFRDWLRINKTDWDKYAQAKRSLATNFDDFIQHKIKRNREIYKKYSRWVEGFVSFFFF